MELMVTDRGAAWRARILAAARELLVERGAPRAVSLDEIAARAGTTKATLYRYFPSKAALVGQVAADGVDTGPVEDRRDQILDAALEVVPRHGIHGTTMERIAAEAGVSPAALYWHFEGKDDLLTALVGRLAARLDLPATLARGSVDDPGALFLGFVPRAMALQGEHAELLGVMLAEVTTRPELAAALYDRVISSVWGALAGHVEREAAQGAFRPGHPLLRVVALVGMVTFYNLARRAFGTRLDVPPPDEAAREFARIFLHGVVANEAAPTADEGPREQPDPPRSGDGPRDTV